MIDTTIINIEDIKKITSISNNIEVDMLEPFLFNSQEIYIRPLLGDAMYTAIIAEVGGTGNTYTSLIEDYIQYALAYATYFTYIPFGHIKLQKKGLVLQTSENSTSASMEEFSMYTKRVESTMTFYLAKMKDYLDDNKITYLLYTSSDQINPQNSSSIFLGF